MALLLSPKLWLAIAVAAILSFYGFVAYRSGAAHVRGQWDAAIVIQQQQAAAAEAENRRMESLRQNKVIEAQNAQTKRSQVLQAAIVAGRVVADSLRHDLAANTASLPSQSPDACRAYAAAANAVLGDMEAAGRGMAEKASGHASDTLTLEQAWPK